MALEMKYVDSKQGDPKPYSQRNPRMDEQKAEGHHFNKILYLLTYILGFIEFQIEEVPKSQEEGPYTMASVHSDETHRPAQSSVSGSLDQAPRNILPAPVCACWLGLTASLIRR